MLWPPRSRATSRRWTRTSWTGLLAQLPDREREIVRLRFYEQQSQEQIAAAVGVSQMQVSRLLRGSFEKMREWMDAESDENDD